MRRYPKYRDSGIPWLGKIPAHWELKRLKYVATLQTGLTLGKAYKDRTLSRRPYLRVANVQDGYFNLSEITTVEVPEEEVSRYELRPGDVLLTEGGDFDKLGRGAVWEGQIEGCLHQNHIFAVRPKVVCLRSRFLAFLMASAHGKTYFTLTSKQTTNLASTNSTTLNSFQVIVPPVIEQEALVCFLDDKLAEAECFIANKEKLIGLLQEQNSALVQRAVTPGLHGLAKGKPSGLDWLGDIPAHWKMKRNGALFGQRVERGIPELPILMVSLHSGVSTDDESEESDRPKRTIEDRAAYKKALKCDIAYNMMRMWQGAVGVVPEDGLVSPAYVVARPFPGVHSGYYAYLFRTDAYKNEINRNSRGIVSDRNRLYWEDFKQMVSPYPPFDEQQSIVARIEQDCSRVDQTISKARREIELIKEYRTTLISDAVTGKIDVRGETS